MNRDESLRAEFDAILAQNQLSVPPAWYEGTLANYADLKRLTQLLRQDVSRELEPASTFRLSAIVDALTLDDAPLRTQHR